MYLVNRSRFQVSSIAKVSLENSSASRNTKMSLTKLIIRIFVLIWQIRHPLLIWNTSTSQPSKELLNRDNTDKKYE